jgi:NADH-ubiquinone oxidoreductase chain 5
VSPANMSLLDGEFLKFHFKIAPVCFSFFGISCCFFLYVFQPKFLFQIKTTKFGLMTYTFFNKKWFIDKIYAETFGQIFLNISYNITYKLVDRGVFEMLGPFGFTNIVHNFTNYLKKLQSGSINHYVYIFLISIMLSMFFHELSFIINSLGLTQQFFVFDFLKMIFLFIISLLLFSY